MSILYFIKTKLILLKLLNICKTLIDQYEVKNIHAPSCKKDLIRSIKRNINKNMSLYFSMKNSEYEKAAHALISQETFDLLVSGKYHIYTGILNQAACGENLLKVYRKNLKYSIKAGEITQEIGDEKCNYLLNFVTGGKTTWQSARLN